MLKTVKKQEETINEAPSGLFLYLYGSTCMGVAGSDLAPPLFINSHTDAEQTLDLSCKCESLLLCVKIPLAVFFLFDHQPVSLCLTRH